MKRINLGHGEGGELTHQLIEKVFIKYFGHKKHTKLDSAVYKVPSEEVAVSTDSFVVKPIFFPGGNIGKLAIAGTVNDLAVSGALPKVITAAFIIEEGFPLPDLKEIVKSMAEEAEVAGVKIIAGDTKVVEKGSADGLFINTTGIGHFNSQNKLCPERLNEGDSIIISGTIGDHGISIVSAREELGLLTNAQSDCASLNKLIEELLEKVEGIRIMRDPTRGGLATTLIELCEDYNFTAELDQLTIPMRSDVHGACDILGFDPLYLANEGKVVMVVDSSNTESVLDILNNNHLGTDASVIGKVVSIEDDIGKLYLKTPIGTTRRLHRLSGMLLPRIC